MMSQRYLKKPPWRQKENGNANNSYAVNNDAHANDRADDYGSWA